MTPQEKAIDLVNMFNSCEYAMICVVEILKTKPSSGYYTDAEYVTNSKIDYWLEVKEEINKL